MKIYKRINGTNLRKQLEHVLDQHERFKNSYFWSSPSNASGRRSYERKNSIEPLKFVYKNDVYEIEQSVSCSCKNIYYNFSIYVNDKKKNITTLKKLLSIDTTPQKPIRACSDGIAFKKLAIGSDGRLYSIYDGSPWPLQNERKEKPRQNHNGGFYVYETHNEALNAPFPDESLMIDEPKAIVKCKVSGNYCRYDSGKLAFSKVTPVKVISFC